MSVESFRVVVNFHGVESDQCKENPFLYRPRTEVHAGRDLDMVAATRMLLTLAI